METLDTITRIFMISSISGMIVYAINKGLNAIDRSTEDTVEDENDVIETTEIMDYDDAVQWYIMQREQEGEREVNFD